MSSSPTDSRSFFHHPEPEQTSPRPYQSPPSQSSPHRPAQPPRLPSSPRLFRDFFSNMPDTASRRQATLPLANYQETVQDVNQALRRATRAIQGAQDALHRQVRRSRTDSEAVDLTNTSPPENSSESHFMSRTTHPHDASSSTRFRRLNTTLDEPVYGSHSRSHSHTLPVLDANDPLALLRLFPVQNPHIPRLPHLQADHNRIQAIVDQEAINRQRENHSNWERTQARNRERILSSPQEPSPEMSPPAFSSSSRSTRQDARSPVEDPTIESVDLTGVDDNATLSSALAKQREDAILAQTAGTEAGRTALTAYKCPVCMDTPTDATTTICGHVFCHRCILDTLNWSIEQRREDAPPNRKVKGVCPVCRKQLDTKDSPGTTRSLVPLELKLMVRKRKRDDKGKQKLVKAETLSDDDDDEDEVKAFGQENVRAGKARKRESTEDALWGAFMADQ
ncbi:hypothetical protein PV11_03224 [Exophiala sideris]|uniref:RING-type domain-containing protein n=1 Tax=Exophiala sideris TaxID=1016849 RepID=A0A0D1Z1D3_9EURO|nr:hypothetical protein PV11_03224 [Exophiala sideris]